MGKGDAYPVPGHLVGLEGKVQGDRRKLHAMAGCQDVKYGLRYSLCAASKICMKRVANDYLTVTYWKHYKNLYGNQLSNMIYYLI